jgi:hypothetical protein
MSNDRITLHKLIKRAQSEKVMNTQDFAEVIQRTTKDHKANHSGRHHDGNANTRFAKELT